MILTITCNSMLYVLAEMLALVVCFEMRSHRVAQFGLKLMGSNDPPVSVLAVSIWDYWHFSTTPSSEMHFSIPWLVYQWKYDGRVTDILMTLPAVYWLFDLNLNTLGFCSKKF